ncbi:MAG: type II secretion system F family protein [Endozoicomonadaceae bacterium]|nr:type II secretion system F family protein [Endozoicomonadaceae bacterium]
MAKKDTLKTYTFDWEGKEKNGKGKKISGKIVSTTVAMAKAELRKQGIKTSKIKKHSSKSLHGSKITPMDIAFFTRQLASMLKAGVPLINSFDVAADSIDKSSVKNLIMMIKNDVAGGNNLANALQRHPEYFDDLYCSLVAAGEQAGALDTTLERVATYKEKSEALKAKIKKAMTYPIAVVAIATLVTGIMLIKVVPQFESVFNSFGAELPPFTQLVVHISEVLQKWWYIVLFLLIAVVLSFRRLLQKSEAARNRVDRMMLHVPILGEILKKSAVARFARTLATTFSAGVSLVDALDSVASAAGNVVFRQAIHAIKKEISTGHQLQFAMRNTNIFPNMATQMVAIGEEAGSLDEMLAKVAVYYEKEVDNMIDNLTSLLEPIIMAVLGVIVGGLIIAMYLPIFQLGSVI